MLSQICRKTEICCHFNNVWFLHRLCVCIKSRVIPEEYERNQSVAHTVNIWSFWILWYVYGYLIALALDVNQRSPSSCAPAVSPRDDQPHVEVGGCMERTGLPGSQCFLCRARRERTLPEICPLGTAWGLFPPPIANRVRCLVLSNLVFCEDITVFTPVLCVCSTLSQSIQGILPYSPAEVPYSGSTRSVCQYKGPT